MGANAREWFTKHLADLLLAAGSPSFRELAMTTSDNLGGISNVAEVARRAGLAPRELAHTTIHDLVKGKRVSAPDAWVVSMFVVACACWGATHGSPVLPELTPNMVRALLAQWQQRRTDYEDLLRTATPAAAPMFGEGTVGFAADILAAMEPIQAASTLSEVPRPSVARMLTVMPPASSANVLATLEREVADEILDLMTPDATARVLPYLPGAVRYLSDAPHYRAECVLAAMTDKDLSALVVGASDEDAGEVIRLIPYSRSLDFLSSLKDDAVVVRMLGHLHPVGASTVGEGLGTARLARILASNPEVSPKVLGGMDNRDVVAVLDLLPDDAAAGLLRKMYWVRPSLISKGQMASEIQRILKIMSPERQCAIRHSLPGPTLSSCWCGQT